MACFDNHNLVCESSLRLGFRFFSINCYFNLVALLLQTDVFCGGWNAIYRCCMKLNQNRLRWLHREKYFQICLYILVACQLRGPGSNNIPLKENTLSAQILVSNTISPMKGIRTTRRKELSPHIYLSVCEYITVLQVCGLYMVYMVIRGNKFFCHLLFFSSQFTIFT